MQHLLFLKIEAISSRTDFNISTQKLKGFPAVPFADAIGAECLKRALNFKK